MAYGSIRDNAGGTKMEWIGPAIEAIVEILVALAPAMAGPSESATSRPKPHAAAEPDNWKCPVNRV